MFCSAVPPWMLSALVTCSSSSHVFWLSFLYIIFCPSSLSLLMAVCGSSLCSFRDLLPLFPAPLFPPPLLLLPFCIFCLREASLAASCDWVLSQYRCLNVWYSSSESWNSFFKMTTGKRLLQRGILSGGGDIACGYYTYYMNVHVTPV